MAETQLKIIHGRNVKILNDKGNALIAGARSCTIQMKADLIEVASAASATAKQYIAGRTSWTVDLTHLLTTPTGGLPLVGTTYTIQYQTDKAVTYSGQVVCTEATITSTLGNLSQGSIKMQGTGELKEKS